MKIAIICYFTHTAEQGFLKRWLGVGRARMRAASEFKLVNGKT